MRTKSKFYLLLAVFQMFLIVIVLFSVNGLVGFAAAQTTGGTASDPMTAAALAIGSSIAVAAGVLASGIAIKTVGTAAISTLAEREESFFKAFLIVALCEALAVYGLIISILLWTKI